jgi:hypothetical protein
VLGAENVITEEEPLTSARTATFATTQRVAAIIQDKTLLLEKTNATESAVEQIREEIGRRRVGQFLLPIMKENPTQIGIPMSLRRTRSNGSCAGSK